MYRFRVRAEHEELAVVAERKVMHRGAALYATSKKETDNRSLAHCLMLCITGKYLNSISFVPSSTENNLITVPFSEAVANLVPEGLKDKAASEDSWAGIINLACRLNASNNWTSPEEKKPR